MIRLGSLENKQGRCHSDTASSLRQPLNSWWPRSSPPPLAIHHQAVGITTGDSRPLVRCAVSQVSGMNYQTESSLDDKVCLCAV